MRARIVIAGALAALAVALTPGAASAATLSASFGEINFNAAAAEANNLTVARSGANFVFTDAPGITITPGAGCATVVANQATCTAAGIDLISIDLEDLNDSAAVGASVTGLGNPNFGDPGAAIIGGAGNDSLTGGPAIVNALIGPDLFTDEPGNDVLVGGSLRDQLIGGSGNDQLTAGADGDSLSGGPGIDTLRGEAGSDSFDSEAVADGADLTDGGSGEDFASYFERTLGISADSDDGADDGEACPGAGCEGDELVAIEEIQGGSGPDSLGGTPGIDGLSGGDGDDTISGGGGADGLSGANGADTIDGGDGPDTVNGSAGNDQITAGAGDDEINDFGETDGSADSDSYSGGTGNDRIDYSGAQGPLSVSLDAVPGDGLACPGAACENDNAQADIEDVLGAEKADILIGNPAANDLDGGAGNDVIVGAGGADGLFGGDGDDSLDGGADADTLDGAAGTDLLRARDLFADQIDCGSSADTVIADGLDLALASCESVAAGVVIVSAKAKGSKVKLKLTCPAAEGAACPVKAKLSFKGEQVAAGKGSVAAGQTKSLKLKLTDAGRELLADKPKLKADAKVTFTDAQGIVLVSEQKVALG